MAVEKQMVSLLKDERLELAKLMHSMLLHYSFLRTDLDLHSKVSYADLHELLVKTSVLKSSLEELCYSLISSGKVKAVENSLCGLDTETPAEVVLSEYDWILLQQEAAYVSCFNDICKPIAPYARTAEQSYVVDFSDLACYQKSARSFEQMIGSILLGEGLPPVI